jgi:hypothetical protein
MIFAILAVLFLIITWQSFTLLIISLERFDFVANAQTNNSTAVLVPSNMNRTDITILESPLFVGIISAGSAIIGGILGSYMTNRSNRQMEDKRYERERKREKEKQAEQEKQNEEYIEKVRVLIYTDLLEASSNFKIIMDKEFWKVYPESGYAETFRHMVESALTSHEFTKLPFDLKLRLFSPEVLYSVQNAYSRIDYCYKTLLILLAQHGSGSLKDFEREVMNIGWGSIKEDIDIVIERLKKILPKTIVDKFKVE